MNIFKKVFVVSFLVYSLFNGLKSHAAMLTRVSDEISNSAQSVGANHQIQFTPTTNLPVSGRALVTFPAGFTIPGALNVTDVDLAIGTGQASQTTGIDGDLNVVGTINASTVNQPGRVCPDGGDMVSYVVISLTNITATLTTAPAAGCFAATGDEVLLINMQGAYNAVTNVSITTNVGRYEIKEVASVVGNVITFTKEKVNFYGDGANDVNIGSGATNQKVIVQRIPKYRDITVPGGATLTVNNWDSAKGGILAFRARNVTVNGSISTTGRGYRAGSGSIGNASAADGESIDGLGLTQAQGVNPRNGRFGGGAGQGNFFGSGAGGGYGTRGSNGSNNRTIGGSVYGTEDIHRLYLGSGGGGPLAINGGSLGSNVVTGGSGGGAMLILADTIVVNLGGNIRARGNNAQAECGVADDESGGGGGSGGSVKFEVGTLTTGTNRISAIGGTGFNCTYAGGNGGNGRIAIQHLNPVQGGTTPNAHQESISVYTIPIALGAVPGVGAGSVHGISVDPPTRTISINLNNADPILAGRAVILKIGTNANNGENGDQQIQNSNVLGVHRIPIQTFAPNTNIPLNNAEAVIFLIRPVIVVAGAQQCSDTIDNDDDGKIDFPADPGCSSATDNDETDPPPPPPPGGGGGGGGVGGGGGAGVVQPPIIIVKAGERARINNASGATVRLDGLGAGAVGGSLTITIQPQTDLSGISITPVSQAIIMRNGTPPNGMFFIAGQSYEVKAYNAQGEAITRFNKPIEMLFQLTDAQTSNAEKSSLAIYFWNTETRQWEKINGAVVDTQKKTVETSVDHLTLFGVVAKPNSAGKRIGDINIDRRVNLTDLSILLFNWGKPKNALADLNGDGTVNLVDFSILLYWWTG